jgi:hypothetical protein
MAKDAAGREIRPWGKSKTPRLLGLVQLTASFRFEAYRSCRR